MLIYFVLIIINALYTVKPILATDFDGRSDSCEGDCVTPQTIPHKSSPTPRPEDLGTDENTPKKRISPFPQVSLSDFCKAVNNLPNTSEGREWLKTLINPENLNTNFEGHTLLCWLAFSSPLWVLQEATQTLENKGCIENSYALVKEAIFRGNSDIFDHVFNWVYSHNPLSLSELKSLASLTSDTLVREALDAQIAYVLSSKPNAEPYFGDYDFV